MPATECSMLKVKTPIPQGGVVIILLILNKVCGDAQVAAVHTSKQSHANKM